MSQSAFGWLVDAQRCFLEDSMWVMRLHLCASLTHELLHWKNKQTNAWMQDDTPALTVLSHYLTAVQSLLLNLRVTCACPSPLQHFWLKLCWSHSMSPILGVCLFVCMSVRDNPTAKSLLLLHWPPPTASAFMFNYSSVLLFHLLLSVISALIRRFPFILLLKRSFVCLIQHTSHIAFLLFFFFLLVCYFSPNEAASRVSQRPYVNPSSSPWLRPLTN